MSIYDQIIKGGNFRPFDALAQGVQFKQQTEANKLASNARQFQNAQNLGIQIAKGAQNAKTPEEWNNLVDTLTSQGVKGAEKYRDRFDQKDAVLKMFGVKPKPPKYAFQEAGAGGDMMQKLAINEANPTQVVPLGKPYKKGSGTTVNIGKGDNKKFWETLGKKEAEEFEKQRIEAQDAAQSININKEAKQLLDSGMVTGSGANFIVNSGKVLQQLGIPIGKDANQTLDNTQAYSAMMGKQVGKIIKDFGAGTGLSDADREYANKIAAGEITLNEESLRKLIDINDRINAAKIIQYNKKAGEVEKNKNYNLPFNLAVTENDIGTTPINNIEPNQNVTPTGEIKFIGFE